MPGSTPKAGSAGGELEALARLGEQHVQVMGVLSRRLQWARQIKRLWNEGNVGLLEEALAEARQDNVVLCDFLRALVRNELTGSLNLDSCQVLLPHVRELVGSKYAELTAVALQMADVLLEGFGDMISETRRTCAHLPERKRDVAQEERLRKCDFCYAEFKEVLRLLRENPAAEANAARTRHLQDGLTDFLSRRWD